MEIGQLVRAAAAGDQTAWNALVDRFGGLVWSVARSHRLGDADAADVVQTTWLRLVERLEDLREPEHVGAWLATTARRECLRTLRTAGRQVPTDDDAVLDRSADEHLDARLLASERDQGLWRAFAQLGARCQALLRLLAADEAPSYQEISASLGMPVGAIGPTRGRCLEQLRRFVLARGITPEAAGSS